MELKKKAAKGLLWASLSQTIVYICEIVTKIVLARILLPSDFGIVTLALVFVNFISLMNGFGIGAALIQKKEDYIKKAEKTAFALSFYSGIFFYLVIFSLALPISYFFDNPHLDLIIKFIGITALIYPLKIVPTSWLTIRFEFRLIALTEIFSQLIFGFTSIFLALAGFGHLSLILGYIIASASYVFLIYLFAGRKFSLKMETIHLKELIRFGKPVSGASVISFFLLNGDKFLVGKLEGMANLGFYSFASSLSDLVISRISHSIAQISLPVYSYLQKQKLQEAFIKINLLILVIILPFIAILLLFGKDIILSLLGQKWITTVVIMQIFAIHGLLRAVHINCSTILTALGQPDKNQKFIFYEFVLLFLGIYPAINYFGIIGAAIAVILTRLIGFSITLKYVLDVLNLKLFSFFSHFTKLFITVSLTSSFFLSLRLFKFHMSLMLLGIFILSFYLVYLLLLGIIDTKITNYIKELGKLILTRK